MTRFGAQLPNFTFDAPDAEIFDRVSALAVAADQSGFHSVWVMDHFFQLPPLGGPDQPMLEAYTLLGALAAVTDQAQLGTLVTGVTYRNPAILAKQITTLDLISKGRAILGIGGAWYDVEHQGLGVDYPRDGVRLDMLGEAVQVCRAMFRGDHADFKGEHYRIEDARNLPAPLQEAGPRIMIGGGGEKRTLKLVATYADECNIAGPVETVRHKIEVLRGHCADVGRDPAEVAITWMTPLILTDSDEHTAKMKDMLQSGGGDETAGFTIGQVEEIPELVTPFVEAGVEEVIFSFAFSTPDQVSAVGEACVKALG